MPSGFLFWTMPFRDAIKGCSSHEYLDRIADSE
jgi:hypothetical protein